MIVKGALAAESDNIAIISNNARGMVFLGTPFHGSPVAPYFKTLSNMVSILHQTHTQKVKDLEQKSEKLRILAESFSSALHQRIRADKEVRVAFFHETKKLRGLLVSFLMTSKMCRLPVILTPILKIVPELNARLPGFGDHASIDGDHSAICKFGDQEDPGYQSVVAAIRKMATADSESRPSGTVSQPRSLLRPV